MRFNDDEVKGKKDQAAGALKEKAGKLTGNTILESEGADQRAAGKFEAGFGKTRRRVGEAVKDLGEKLGK